MQKITFPPQFEFGISNASAQVEDQLDDAWMQFAQKGRVKCFDNQLHAQDKLKFWSEPQIEIDLAAKLGCHTFRMSIDWQRLVPSKPSVGQGVIDKEALKHYAHIIKLIKKHKMKVMVTLFHHSLPKWAIDMEGWTNPLVIDYFCDFSRDVICFLEEQVDYWNTFNEPNVFAMFSCVAGNWPPGKKNILATFKIPFVFKGAFYKALENMAQAHRLIYDEHKKRNNKLVIGVGHNMAYYKKGSICSFFAVYWSWKYMNFTFLDLIADHLDFLGFNYYGSEYMSAFGIKFQKDVEYNDAGRAIDVDGFYRIIKLLYKRYHKPLYITENGIADEDDILRSSYLIEHLKALHCALNEGVEVWGYLHWSLTDNFEWSDGYGPKFGLCAVDRKSFKRNPRESFYLYQRIIQQMSISSSDEETSWNKVVDFFGRERKMYRHSNAQDALDSPRITHYTYTDWRFKSKGN